jgi:hypothetical protein
MRRLRFTRVRRHFSASATDPAATTITDGMVGIGKPTPVLRHAVNLFSKPATNF